MQIFNDYIVHLTQYYETDQMGVVHHANYVKWMEEARNNFFNTLEISLSKIEKENVFIPVLFQTVTYNKSIKYNEEIKITCICKKFNGVKIEFLYEFYRLNTNELCAVGKTIHGFVNSNFEPILFKDKFLKEYNRIKESVKI